MASEFEAPIRGVRDNLAAIVDRAADTGEVTYITRHGDRVAAIVPLGLADRPKAGQPEPVDNLRPRPSAEGGRLSAGTGIEADPEFTAWTRAALESLHLRLTNTLTLTATAAGITGRALAALSEGHFGTIEHLLDHLDANAIVNEAAYAEELYNALTDPDDAECTVCGEQVNIFHGSDEWQHWRLVPNEWGGKKTEIFEPETPHKVEPRWVPRERPAITDATVRLT